MQGTAVQPLISLTYVSSAVRKFSDDELVALLRTSRRNNERGGISGMLLYKDGDFMQTLEGPEDAVSNTIAVIGRDVRHRGIIRLIRRPLTERSFGDWSMAFGNLDRLSTEDSKAFSPFLSGSLVDDSFRHRPENCFKLMMAFKKNVR